MIGYLLLLVTSFLIIFLSIDEKIWGGKWLLLPFFIVALICMAGLRVGIGADYESYMNIYKNAPGLGDIQFIHFALVEPGYLLLNVFAKSLNLGFPFVAFTLSTIIFCNLLLICRRVAISPLLVIPLYFALFYLSHQFNILRHGIAISFIWLGFTYIKDKRFFKFIIYLLLGALFHKVALIAIPFYFILRFRFRFWVVVAGLGASFLIGLKFEFLNNPIFAILFADSERYQYYMNDYYLNIKSQASFGISLGTLLNMVWILLIYHKWFLDERPDNIIFANALFFGVCAVGLFNKNGVFVERISGLFYPALLLIIPQFYLKFRKQWLIVFLVMAYCTFYFLKVITTKNRFGEYEYIPYKSLLTSSQELPTVY